MASPRSAVPGGRASAARIALVVAAIVLGVALRALPTPVGADADTSAAQVTRTLRIVKVTDAPEHPGGAFGGSVSMGVGPYTLTLAPNALSSDPVEYTIGISTYGIVESAWPAGWSFVGFHFFVDPAGTATCDPYGSYGTPNIIPAGTDDILVCIKNSYTADPGTRSFRLGVVATVPQHPAAVFTVRLSTGDEVHLLPEGETTDHDEVEISAGSAAAEILVPVNWWAWRSVVVADPEGTRTCSVGLVSLSSTVPPGDGRYLVCFEATYYPPGLPTPLRIGVFTASTNHPGGSFEFLVGNEVVVVELEPGAAVASVDLEVPRERIAIGLRPPWPAGWNPRRFWTIGSQVLVDCSEPLPGPGGPGTGIVLDLGPEPTTLCFQLAYVPFKLYAPLVAAD